MIFCFVTNVCRGISYTVKDNFVIKSSKRVSIFLYELTLLEHSPCMYRSASLMYYCLTSFYIGRCEMAQLLNWPFKYSKYASQSMETLYDLKLGVSSLQKIKLVVIFNAFDFFIT